MVYGIFSALFIGGLIGVLSEKLGLTRNGYIVSAALGIGGAMILVFGQLLFGFSLGFGRALTSAIGASAMLLIASMRR